MHYVGFRPGYNDKVSDRLGMTRPLLAFMLAMATCESRAPIAIEGASPQPDLREASPQPDPDEGRERNDEHAAGTSAPRPACNFGSIVGSAAFDPVVEPGTYAAQYDFSRHEFLTVERSASQTFRGAATLTFEPEGGIRGCLGLAVSKVSSVGRYESDDKQDHSEEARSRQLIGVAGRWESSSDGVGIRLDHMGWGRCDTVGERPHLADTQLVCGTLAANDRLPTRALICQVIGTLPTAEELGLDLSESTRAGAWVFRLPLFSSADDPQPPCRPWLVLGALPGIRVMAHGGRQVTFSLGVSAFREVDYVEPTPDVRGKNHSAE